MRYQINFEEASRQYQIIDNLTKNEDRDSYLAESIARERVFELNAAWEKKSKSSKAGSPPSLTGRKRRYCAAAVIW